jgi:2-oxoglutarate ferredoxin oxidoreductase subunit beta
MTYNLRNYLRDIKMPFCQGCGAYAVINSFLKAINELGYSNLNDFVFCSGIGCASWIPSPHFKADSIHTPHGRSIPIATGIKLLRPDLNVIVFGGDGDITGIGLGHFIHASRRNLDVLVIIVNNMIYGMTGGQVSPTTPLKIKTKTTPYGSFEHPLDIVKIAISAGSTYVARWTTIQISELKESIKEAIKLKGFRVIEVVSQCPTSFGRNIGLKTTKEIVNWIKNNSFPIEKINEISNKEKENKIFVGKFHQINKMTLDENIKTTK